MRGSNRIVESYLGDVCRSGKIENDLPSRPPRSLEFISRGFIYSTVHFARDDGVKIARRCVLNRFCARSTLPQLRSSIMLGGKASSVPLC